MPSQLARTPDGHLIIATFAPDGPSKRGGWEVALHDAASIGAKPGLEFRLEGQTTETRATPWRTEPKFGCSDSREEAVRDTDAR